jgi:hypothetical protein
VRQNEAGVPENRMVVLRACPDAPSRNFHPVLGPVVTARLGILPFCREVTRRHTEGSTFTDGNQPVQA